MEKLVINGFELELDLMDADVLEIYEEECQKMQDKTQEVRGDESISNADGIRKLCQIVDGLFDNLFGAGTAAELFGNGYNLRPRLTGFSEMVNYARRQSLETSAMLVSETDNAYHAARREPVSREPRKIAPVEQRAPIQKAEKLRTYNTKFPYASPEEMKEFRQWVAERRVDE